MSRNQSPPVKPPAGYRLPTPQEAEVGLVVAFSALELLARLGTPNPEKPSHRTLNIYSEIDLSLSRYRSADAKSAADNMQTTITVEARYLGQTVMTVEWVHGSGRTSAFNYMKYEPGPWMTDLLAHHQIQLQDGE